MISLNHILFQTVTFYPSRNIQNTVFDELTIFVYEFIDSGYPVRSFPPDYSGSFEYFEYLTVKFQADITQEVTGTI